MSEVAAGYSNLEFNLETSKRGSRTARRAGASPLVEDLGSGTLLEFARACLAQRPAVVGRPRDDALHLDMRTVADEEVRPMLDRPRHRRDRHAAARNARARCRGRDPAAWYEGASVGRLRIGLPEGRFAQLACERPLCTLAGERFILRDDAARCTLAGGRVLAPHARRVATRSQPWRERLARLASTLLEDRLVEALRSGPEGALSLSRLAREHGVAPEVLGERLLATGKAALEGEYAFFAPRLAETERALATFVE